MLLKKVIVVIGFLLLSNQASATDVFLQGGLHFGGDTLVTAVFTDGSSESLKAGGLLSGALGIETDISESVYMKLSAGLKFDTILAENTDVFFERYPLEALFFYRNENIHIGAG